LVRRPCPHVFLAGRTVSEDWELIRALKSDHIITLLESFDLVRLAKSPLLKSATLIVVDCGGQENEATRTLKAIKMICKRFQRPTVVLVDGQLDQWQVAQAFRMGVRDYFRSPYGARLLAERIRHAVPVRTGVRRLRPVPGILDACLDGSRSHPESGCSVHKIGPRNNGNHGTNRTEVVSLLNTSCFYLLILTLRHQHILR
jgi:DNA-binding response OmpR family regulator